MKCLIYCRCQISWFKGKASRQIPNGNSPAKGVAADTWGERRPWGHVDYHLLPGFPEVSSFPLAAIPFLSDFVKADNIYENTHLMEAIPYREGWFKKIFYWNIITLQGYISFCCTTKWTSYICIHISPPSCTSLLQPCSTLLGPHRAPDWAPCAIQHLPTTYLFYTWSYISVGPSLPFIPPFPSPPLGPHVHSLCLCLYSCPANLEKWYWKVFFKLRCDWHITSC